MPKNVRTVLIVGRTHCLYVNPIFVTFTSHIFDTRTGFLWSLLNFYFLKVLLVCTIDVIDFSVVGSAYVSDFLWLFFKV